MNQYLVYKSYFFVSINVRRGDFVQHSVSSSFHGFRGLEYIYDAVNLIKSKVDKPHFYVFSDDIEWCAENIKTDDPLTIVDHTHAGKKFADYLHLMKECKHFIIPNSSFAWWAAWLSENHAKIVIAPKKWLNDSAIDTSDVTPAGWYRI